MIKLETQGFCINLIVSTRSLTIITLEAKEGVLPPQIVVMDYDNLPLRCTCYSCARKVKNNLQKNHIGEKKDHPMSFTHPKKEKGRALTLTKMDINKQGVEKPQELFLTQMKTHMSVDYKHMNNGLRQDL